MQKYTIKDFYDDFPNDGMCLHWLKNYRWPDGITCKKCKVVTKHHLMEGRRSFSCQECGHHVHPTAGTIFHKSPTPLTLWFYATYLMAQTRGGISAKQIERETGVTYKTAWRMCHMIRKQLDEGNNPMGGSVEIDESYFGGRGSAYRGRGSSKQPVIGIVQRGGRAKTKVVPNVKKASVYPVIQDNVVEGTQVYTDEYIIYKKLPTLGYKHDHVKHRRKVYVEGIVHTNGVEGFWGLVKPGIKGVYRHVSPKYLQTYLDEYCFRYNRRYDETPMFLSFLERTGLTV